MQLPIEQFRSARRAAAPLVAIKTPDPIQTMNVIVGRYSDVPVFRWDVASGLSALTETAKEAIPAMHPNPAALVQPAMVLAGATDKMPPKGILFLLNFNWFLAPGPHVQALYNWRDKLKADGRMLVIVGFEFVPPMEITNDFVVINETLPDENQLNEIIIDLYSAATQKTQLPELTDHEKQNAVAALVGLASFPAEQAVAMSITKKGLNLKQLWELKARMISETPGLSIWQGGETFDDVAGYENIKNMLTRYCEGRVTPGAVVFIDEIEKMIGGTEDGDSGVSRNMFGMLLSEMSDNAHYTGAILLGAPGTGKSAIAKATGAQFDIPTIAFSMNETKAKLVGESERQFRQALKVIHRVSGGKALFLATCNKIVSLPPELRRRFKLGVYMFDLPSPKERAHIWNLYLNKYQFPVQPLPNDEGWTGAEIKQCCDLAYQFESTLLEAAPFIVPVATSAAEQLEDLRAGAHDRYLCASNVGKYQKDRHVVAANTRQFSIEEED